MKFGGDVVAGAMGEVITEAGVLDHLASGIVCFEAVDWEIVGEGLLDDGDSGVAGVADGLEDLAFEVSWLAADDACPGDVVMDVWFAACLRIGLTPDVN